VDKLVAETRRKKKKMKGIIVPKLFEGLSINLQQNYRDMETKIKYEVAQIYKTFYNQQAIIFFIRCLILVY
jgi:hypothetical protein